MAGAGALEPAALLAAVLGVGAPRHLGRPQVPRALAAADRVIDVEERLHLLRPEGRGDLSPGLLRGADGRRGGLMGEKCRQNWVRPGRVSTRGNNGKNLTLTEFRHIRQRMGHYCSYLLHRQDGVISSYGTGGL